MKAISNQINKDFNPRLNVYNYQELLAKSKYKASKALEILNGQTNISYGIGKLQTLDVFYKKIKPGGILRISVRPIISFIEENPKSAIISLISSAINMNRLTISSGLPVKRLRSSVFWVATPTGQVFKWHFLIIIQPSATKAAVAKPHSSAPSSAPTTTSRPVLNPPST